MDAQITAVLDQLTTILLQISFPAALLRLVVAGLKHLAGDPESVSTAIRQVAIGIFIIVTSRALVSLIYGFAEAVSRVTP